MNNKSFESLTDSEWSFLSINNCLPEYRKYLDKRGQNSLVSTESTRTASANIFLDGLFADATITVKGENISVHKVLLSMKSSVFLEAFKTKDRLVVDDVEPETFRQFLFHLYTSTSPTISKLSTEILVCARKFRVDGLVEHFLSHFEKAPTASVAPALLVVAHFCDWKTHKDKLMNCVRNHLKEVMLTTEWKAVLREFDLVTELLLSFPNVELNENYNNENFMESKVSIIWSCPIDNYKVVGSFDVQIREGTASFQIHFNEGHSFNLTMTSATCNYPMFLEAEFQLSTKFKQIVLKSSNVFSWFAPDFESSSKRKFIFSLIKADEFYLENAPFQLTIDVPTTANQRLVEPSMADDIRQSTMKNYLTKKYTDVRFKAGNRIFEGHRILLSRRSSYFAELVQSNEDPVVLTIAEKTFQILFDYVYFEEFPKEELVDVELLRSAKIFRFPKLFEHSETRLIRQLSPRNCLKLLIAAFQLEANRLKSKALRIVNNNLSTIVVSPGWKQLADYPELVCELLALR